MQPLVDRWVWVSILPLFYISPNDSVVSKLAHFELPLLSLTQTITLLVKVTFVCRICSILTSFFILIIHSRGLEHGHCNLYSSVEHCGTDGL